MYFIARHLYYLVLLINIKSLVGNLFSRETDAGIHICQEFMTWKVMVTGHSNLNNMWLELCTISRRPTENHRL